MKMPTFDERYDSTKAIATYHRLAGIALGIAMPPAMSFHAVRRMIEVDEEDETVTATDNDPLSEMIVHAARRMAHTERSGSTEVDIEPVASLSALFDANSSTAKSYKPRLYIAIDLRGKDATICGLCSTCEWTRDESLGTDRFTQHELRRLQLPRLDRSWLLIDVITSSKRGAGALLALQVYLLSCRSRMYNGVAAIAVSRSGRRLFEALGFETVSFREGGMNKAVCYAHKHSLSLRRIQRRLSFPGDQTLLQSMCYREGITPRSSGNIYSRC